MVGTRHLLAMVMSYLLSGVPGGGKSDVLGIVVQANHASLGSQATSDGTTVYDGDRLSTGVGGTLQLRSNGVMLYLAEDSSVIVRNGGSTAAKEFEAELVAGTAIMSATAGTAAEIVIRSARVRIEANKNGAIQVRILDEKELAIFAQRESAQLYYRNETATIPEGTLYRVLLDPDDDAAAVNGNSKQRSHHGRAFMLIAIAVAGAAAGISITSAPHQKPQLESPDRP